VFQQHRFSSSVIGSKMRVGDIVQREGKIIKISSVSKSVQGRGTATFTFEAFDFSGMGKASGNKIIFKAREGDKYDFAELKTSPYQFLYYDDSLLYLMDAATFEQVEIQRDLATAAIAYLKPDDVVKVLTDERTKAIIDVKLPDFFEVTVVECADPVGGSSVNDIKHKTAQVQCENGTLRPVKVPPSTKVGDVIKIDSVNEEFAAKVKAER
jgi:translation elongation factor P/translation initiation factor 5A